MGIPKFKVGDKVRVLRAATNAEYHLWGDCWCGWMDENIGKVLIVDKLRNHGSCYKYYKYCLGGSWYPEFVLQNKVVAGQQLLFDFMSKE